MADLDAKVLTIAIVMVIATIAGLATYSTFLLDSNSAVASADSIGKYNQTFSRYNELQANYDAFNSNVTGTSIDSNTDPSWLTEVKGALNSIWNKFIASTKVFSLSLSFMDDVWSNSGSILGMPSWFAGIILILIGLIIIFALIKYVTGV